MRKIQLKNNFCAIVVGAVGTGKTTLIKKIAKAYYDTGYKLVAYDPPLAFYEFNPLYIYDKNIPVYNNTLYIFDDATGFFNLANNITSILQLITTRRHRNNSFIFTFHAIAYIPLQIASFADTFILFKTTDRTDVLASKTKDLNLPYPPSNNFEFVLCVR